MPARLLLCACLLALFVPQPLRAQDCEAAFTRFANELDRMADTFDKMADEKKPLAEVCAYKRSVAIPLHRRILSDVEALGGRCGPRAIGMAREQLDEAVASEREDCAGIN